MSNGGSSAQERFAAFDALVRSTSATARWLVLTHDNPDPDALASAATITHLLRKGYGRRAVSAFGGIVGRAENREMVRALKIELVHVRALKWVDYQHFILVDTQPGTGNNQLPEILIPDVVLDHHPVRKASHAARLADIRTSYDATATIAAEYLMSAGLDPTRRQATAVVYALRSETQDFSRGATGDPDKNIYDTLLPLADKRALARIVYPRLPLTYFRNLHQAMENLEASGNLVVSHLGELEQPDIVPQIADLLVRLEGRTWSLATGVYGDRVYLSIRTTNTRADAGRLMRRLLGRRGKGGGHGMIAGGWIPVAKAPAGDVRALQRQLAESFAKALGRNPERLLPLDLTEPSASGLSIELPALPAVAKHKG
jgi:nanoRNase/pAp phosphatase (c-di-AMP/oligoRNAs hydrolase)